VDPAIAAVALDEALPEVDEAASAMRLARAFASRSGADVGRIASRLVRKGFRPALALRVAREAFDAPGDDDTPDQRFQDE
jgi:hypothetical protein